jgi:beta-aspartyl-peptidase (threonine type)
MDAVEAAVSVMEDDTVFNAGKGSSLTAAGTVEMDAAIMNGRDLSAGAVALVHSVKNPIRLARIVMEKTDHVLLAGEKAEELARAFSQPTANPVTAPRQRLLSELRQGGAMPQSRWIEKNLKLLAKHPELIVMDTVGAVALDEEGNFAAAASTGGPTMKLPGRVGDTPQIGSGLYADNQAGAATVTGLGEIAVKLTLSKHVCSLMESGLTVRRCLGRGKSLNTVERRGRDHCGGPHGPHCRRPKHTSNALVIFKHSDEQTTHASAWEDRRPGANDCLGAGSWFSIAHFAEKSQIQPKGLKSHIWGG